MFLFILNMYKQTFMFSNFSICYFTAGFFFLILKVYFNVLAHHMLRQIKCLLGTPFAVSHQQNWSDTSKIFTWKITFNTSQTQKLSLQTQECRWQKGVKGICFGKGILGKGIPGLCPRARTTEGEGPGTATEAALGTRQSSEWYAFTTTGETEMNELTLNLREKHTGEKVGKNIQRKQEENDLHSKDFLHYTHSVPCN